MGATCGMSGNTGDLGGVIGVIHTELFFMGPACLHIVFVEVLQGLHVVMVCICLCIC